MNTQDFSNLAFGLATLLSGGYGTYLGIQQSDPASIQQGLGLLAGGAVQFHAGWNGQPFIPPHPLASGYCLPMAPQYTLSGPPTQMLPAPVQQKQVVYLPMQSHYNMLVRW